MKEWFRLALEPSVVKRALVFAGVVGIILIAINHGDALVRGEINSVRLLKMGLTVLVPYLVSTFSSVGAMRKYRCDQDNLEQKSTMETSKEVIK